MRPHPGILGFLGVLGLLVLAAPARAQSTAGILPPDQKPTTKVLDCTSGGCHAKVMDFKFLHGPTAVQACDACHEYADPSQHTFGLKRQGAALCSFCHLDKTGKEGPVVHDPVAKGECTKCHSPHGSNTRKQLKAASSRALCVSCHDKVVAGKNVHGPAVTDCTSCHRPHSGDLPKLLIKERQALCMGCHEDVQKDLGLFKFAHKPVSEDCAKCHSPHSSDEPKMLRQAPKDLCTSCHTEIGTLIKSVKHPHAATTTERGCLNCHVAHASDHKAMLQKDQISACLACHRKQIKVDDEHVVASLASLTLETTHKHGPIRDGECAPCHNVHGSDEAWLLSQPISQQFYQPFSDNAYSLCFKCHDKTLVTTEKAGKETGFRNGDKNLHHVHSGEGDQGRSCLACHDVHVAKNAKQVAESVTYGQWKLPLNYKQAENGGSCAPGCHKPAAYDRITSTPGILHNAAPPQNPPPLGEKPGAVGPDPTGAPGPTKSPAPSTAPANSGPR